LRDYGYSCYNAMSCWEKFGDRRFIRVDVGQLIGPYVVFARRKEVFVLIGGSFMVSRFLLDLSLIFLGLKIFGWARTL
jgi:hypothetical protein